MAGPPPPPTSDAAMEYQFVKIPFEQYKNTIISSLRIASKEISAVLSRVSSPADRCDETSIQDLTSMASRLRYAKRKLEEVSEAETLQAKRIRARLDYLESANADNLKEWNDTKVRRILVDYMLRMSYADTAIKLAEISNIQDFVDIDFFLEAKKIIDSLLNKEAGPALAWCAENRSRLKKINSDVEFRLRYQEFRELVRAEKYLEGIEYARKYLATWGSTYRTRLRHVLAILAFKSDTKCLDIKIMFDEDMWRAFALWFQIQFCRSHSLTEQSLLYIFLQAGLSVLKTPFCYKDNCPKEDPLSQESFRELAEELPMSVHPQSKFFCQITRELMDGDNPPLVLPNGYAYSMKPCLLHAINRHWMKWPKRMVVKLLARGPVMCSTILSLSRLSFRSGVGQIHNYPHFVRSANLHFSCHRSLI